METAEGASVTLMLTDFAGSQAASVTATHSGQARKCEISERGRSANSRNVRTQWKIDIVSNLRLWGQVNRISKRGNLLPILSRADLVR